MPALHTRGCQALAQTVVRIQRSLLVKQPWMGLGQCHVPCTYLTHCELQGISTSNMGTCTNNTVTINAIASVVVIVTVIVSFDVIVMIIAAVVATVIATGIAFVTVMVIVIIIVAVTSTMYYCKYPTCNRGVPVGDGGCCGCITRADSHAHIGSAQGYEVVDAIAAVHACLPQPLRNTQLSQCTTLS